MRLRKYYDALRTNSPFFETSIIQKVKILLNILKFFRERGKIIIRNKPVIAQIEPTSQCNLKCKMCIRDKIGVPIGNLSFENFKKILEKLDSLFKIHLSGQGEPFLNKEIFEMIRYANKKGILINTNTNATTLTKEVILKISDVEIGEIGISIDSPDKKEYEKIRKGAKFEKVIENVKNLTRELKKKERKTIVTLAAVILKNNINELPEFINLARKLGIRKIVFQTIQEKEDYVKKYSKETKGQRVSELKNLRENINKTKELAKKYGIVVIFDEEKSPGCIWPWRSIYINWEGYVTLCCKILDYRKPLIGNILQQDFEEIWNSREYQIARKLLKERKAPLQCKGCNMV